MTDRSDRHTPGLMTFALLSYNQEAFVREAIEGAFAQTYEPLEIVLSDDCSTDGTFAIIQEMAAAYRGPHRVIVRCNPFNLGTALHVQSAFAESSGDLFVIAAGDDVSEPERVSSLVRAWIEAACPEGVVHSARKTLVDGMLVGHVPAKRYPYSGNELKGYARSYWLPAAAPTCAYTRGVFELFAPLPGGSIIEDAPLFLRAALIGRFVRCDKSLVRHRCHDANNGTGYTIEAPASWNRFIQSKMIAFRTMQADLLRYQGDIDPRLLRRIERRILKVLHCCSPLLVPQIEPVGLLGRFRLGWRIATAPAVARTFRLRIEYMLSFFAFTAHVAVKDRLRQAIALVTGKR